MTNSFSTAALLQRLRSSHLQTATGSCCEEETVALFSNLRKPLLRYLSTFGLAAHDAEEIVQEAFLALFEHLKRGKSRSNLQGWIFRVCHNMALKHISRARIRTGVITLQADASPTPEELVVEAQRRERLQAVLQALPEQDRYCVCLRAEGLRYREIAEILGISLGSVSISLARSLARFERADQK